MPREEYPFEILVEWCMLMVRFENVSPHSWQTQYPHIGIYLQSSQWVMYVSVLLVLGSVYSLCVQEIRH